MGHLDGTGRVLLVSSLTEANAVLPRTPLVASAPISAVAAGADLTGDSLPDVALGAGGRVMVFVAGNPTPIVLEPPTPSTSGTFGSILASGGDLTGNGVSELVIRDPTTQRVNIYQYNGAGFRMLANPLGTASGSAAVVLPGDLEPVLPDDAVVLDGINVMRVHRGGFATSIAGTFTWRAPVGSIIAGTPGAGVRGRYWSLRSRSTTQHGFVTFGLSGTDITSTVVDAVYSSPVRLVAR
ncbi:MAG: hypothetical protein R3A48_11490 [Polyangiales bacterium]